MCNVYIFPNPPKPSFVIRSSSHSPFNHLQGPASLWDLSSLTYSLGSSQRGCLTELPKHTAACSHLTVFALVFSLPKALFVQISPFSLSLSLSQTYIFYFLSLLSSKGRSLRCSPGQGNPRGCIVTLCMGHGSEREQCCLLCSLPVFSHFPVYPQLTWALLVLIPRWVSLCTFYDLVGLSSKLSCEAGSFSYCSLNPHRYFK